MKRIIGSLYLVLVAWAFPSLAVDGNDIAIKKFNGIDMSKLQLDAEKGDADAQNTLGAAYFYGRGVPKNCANP